MPERNGGRPAETAMPTDPAELEREIAARRARLADTVNELAARTRPEEVARRGLADLRARVDGATRLPDGTLRTERVAAVAAAVVLVLLLVVRRGRRSR